jgi:hypothetical protein
LAYIRFLSLSIGCARLEDGMVGCTSKKKKRMNKKKPKKKKKLKKKKN